MYVDDTFYVWPSAMDGRMQHKTSNVYTKVSCTGLNYMALHINLDQRGGSDLVVKHSKWIKQKMFRLLADPNLKLEGM